MPIKQQNNYKHLQYQILQFFSSFTLRLLPENNISLAHSMEAFYITSTIPHNEDYPEFVR